MLGRGEWFHHSTAELLHLGFLIEWHLLIAEFLSVTAPGFADYDFLSVNC